MPNKLNPIDEMHLKMINKGYDFIHDSVKKGEVCRNCTEDATCVEIFKTTHGTCTFFRRKATTEENQLKGGIKMLDTI